MKVISLVNHKGGVGKTTITFNLAVNLTKLGYKVLVIDFDSQGNLSKTVGIEQKYDIENKSYKIGTALEEIMRDLETKLELDKYIHASSKYSDLDIIPCDLSFAETKLRLNAATERCFVLNILINQIKEERDYDFILIDNAPSIGFRPLSGFSFSNSVCWISAISMCPYTFCGLNLFLSFLSNTLS